MTPQRFKVCGPVKPMGGNQFNLLADPTVYLPVFQAAGCETNEAWAGNNPLKVTISSKPWVAQLKQLDSGAIVEYELETVQRRDKKSPTGFKIGTRGVSMRIL